MAEAEVIVQLRTSPGPAPAGTADVLDVRSLLERRFGVEAEMLYPGADAPDLIGWQRIAVPAGVDAEAVATALRGHPAVEAAYVKPPADLP
ncbi:hypothetical protein OG785_02765 [Streptomyces sp. NBC_00006]|uniref:hypothetical protein n=1 Tax=unclassified Streptomyces TaxID=2593676 RepID=UPI00225BBD9B|nr:MULTISPECIES: hypothetical protein [unclassified Streptomyces]MCX4834672.1 hypothetical protein [Streptomyces sp. NBC_01016]MCX5529497.1 hypothetical protein [Streptomyces sp. NBC_00006]